MNKLLTKAGGSVITLAFLTSLIPGAAFAAATAAPITASATQGVATPITLTATSDIPSSTITYTADATSAQGGSITVSGDTATYTSAAAFVGSDTFSYTADDGGAASTNTVTVTVNAPAPVVTSATVTSQSEFDTAMGNSAITTITIAKDFQVSSTLNITRSVTIEGGDHTITVAESVDGSAVLITGSDVTINHLKVDSAGKAEKGLAGIQGIQAYKASNVTLNSVASMNAGKSGVMVNGSTVTVNNVTTSGNTWHGINVDQGSGVTTSAVLTVQGTSSHAEMTLTNPSIYIDDTSKGSVTGSLDQYTITNIGSAREYNLDPNYASIPACSSDNTTFDTFSLGSVNGQHGWNSTGSFDQSIVKNEYGYSSFGCKSLRISNAVTSSSFGDQTFSYSAANEAGETQASSTNMSGGTRQNHFEAQFDIASAASTTVQNGLSLSVSPDRGDGSRMSYLRFEDSASGINVFFYDVQGTSSPANFVQTQIAGGTAATPALSHASAHTVKFSIDYVDGPGNDIVNIYIDGVLVHTGTTWENYYRYDVEQTPSGNAVPTTDSLLFRASGTAAPATSGMGFLFDNVGISTSNTSTSTGTTGTGSSSGGSSNRSRPGSSTIRTISTTPTTPTGGAVLGAAAFNFTRDLRFGLTGADVTELQTELIAAGYSIPASATGWFGPQTRAAVAKWQADHEISPAAGYFGPISRAKYAADGGFHIMTTPVTTTNGVAGCQPGFAFSSTTGQACK